MTMSIVNFHVTTAYNSPVGCSSMSMSVNKYRFMSMFMFMFMFRVLHWNNEGPVTSPLSISGSCVLPTF
jgi:hypothetical protein